MPLRRHALLSLLRWSIALGSVPACAQILGADFDDLEPLADASAGSAGRGGSAGSGGKVMGPYPVVMVALAS